MATFARKKKPPDGKRHGWYKDCLRLDFEFRCAYCLIHEADYQSPEDFQVDHFRPQSRFPALASKYRNLYNACHLCNKTNRKGDRWPSKEEEARGERFVDPCEEDWEGHVEFVEDGSVRPLTPAGDYSVRTIDLDRDQLRTHRWKFPGEYFNRSALRGVKRRLDGVSAIAKQRRDLPDQVNQEIRCLQQQFLTLQESVDVAWTRKKALPPEPHCPY